MRIVCNSHLQYKILQNYMRNDFNCFLASSKGIINLILASNVEYSSGPTTVFDNQHMATQTYIIYCCSNHGENNCQLDPNRNGLVVKGNASR